jgi:hypothetical protein
MLIKNNQFRKSPPAIPIAVTDNPKGNIQVKYSFLSNSRLINKRGQSNDRDVEAIPGREKCE